MTTNLLTDILNTFGSLRLTAMRHLDQLPAFLGQHVRQPHRQDDVQQRAVPAC